MALSAEQEQLEHELRVDQLKTAIDAGRVDIDKMRADMRWESRKFLVQLLVGVAASVGAGVGAGVAIANYANGKAPSSTPQPQIIYILPGPTPAVPPPR